jgi:acyl-ACP thioesterase
VTDDPVTVPLPAPGRIYTGQRRVRLGDASPGGRLRFDALARYLQDVSNDDTRDGGLDDDGWVVRRTAVLVEKAPVIGEELVLRTFCSGTGARWAQRRVQARGDRGGAVEATSLWVHVDLATGRPAPLTERFFALYGEAAGGRTVRARLVHPDPPADGCEIGRSWPLRATDFDVMRHMNNAVYWAAVEDELHRRRDLRAPLRAEVEFRDAIEPGDDVQLVTQDGEGELRLWLVRGTEGVAASAHLWRRA